MGKKQKQKKVPDINPQALIRENSMMNRANVNTPFGSQVYGTGPDGRSTLTTELSPEMKQLVAQQFQRAGQAPAQYHAPQGQNQLLASLLARVNSRYAPPPIPGA